jgi:hypothetical protein
MHSLQVISNCIHTFIDTSEHPGRNLLSLHIVIYPRLNNFEITGQHSFDSGSANARPILSLPSDRNETHFFALNDTTKS